LVRGAEIGREMYAFEQVFLPVTDYFNELKIFLTKWITLQLLPIITKASKILGKQTLEFWCTC